MGTWSSSTTTTDLFWGSFKPISFTFHSQSIRWTACRDSASLWWRSSIDSWNSLSVAIILLQWKTKRAPYLDFLPLVIDILEPGEEKATIVAGPCITILLFLFRCESRIDFLILEKRADGKGERLVGQSSGRSAVHSQDFLLNRLHQLFLLNQVLERKKRWLIFHAVEWWEGHYNTPASSDDSVPFLVRQIDPAWEVEAKGVARQQGQTSARPRCPLSRTCNDSSGNLWSPAVAWAGQAADSDACAQSASGCWNTSRSSLWRARLAEWLEPTHRLPAGPPAAAAAKLVTERCWQLMSTE